MFKTIRSKFFFLIFGLMIVISLTFIFITTKNYQTEITKQYYRLARETLNSTIRVIDTEYNDLLSFEIDSINNQRTLMENMGTNVLSMVDSFYDQQNSGLLTEQVAKENCLKRLQKYRYQKNRYFFVYDMDLIGLSHPIKEMVGKKWSMFEDLKKKDALSLVKEIIEAKEKVFTVFMWPRLKDKKQVKQIGFFMYYPQWQWIIGTAYEIGEIERISQAKEKHIFSKLNILIGQSSLNEIGGILIFDSNGKTMIHTSNLKNINLSHSGIALNESIKDNLKKATIDLEKPIEYKYSNKNTGEVAQIAYVGYYKYMDWYIAAFVDKDRLKRPGSAIAARQTVFLLLVSFAGIIFAFFISGRIASSISSLAKYAKDLPSYNFNLGKNPALESIISKSSSEEINQLTNAFGFMETRLGNNIRDMENYQKNLKELVYERTQELSSANKNLRQEITERELVEQQREKLIKDLQEALDKVKTLSGLLPICANCKKIRDDQGYWNNLEAYLEQHSEVLFTHSMCKDCSDDLYGIEKWYLKNKKRKDD